ncbi:dihydroxyacetone kinase family protein [Sinorhizobium meliloti]|uniref:dihydroxyacetone kinase family protein n=1 Tax=Rhizobium meliloti TaxID=382 RepID=UPI000FD46A50|nr:dihydroxyacetone kinase family protein [Sinorhizobium meliloti]MQV24850.1 dihydroxyacetone kinase subunit DhaK [Sinorhizobium meliloti]MQV37480.1 dihydroxyacetone kinase subunit DhaK [Sinorhizobium meliloti]RVE79221.1 dihydroxyacetone kinase subunit DhaK [Sinorhizobium meliloti]RVG42705.1 dihydroxyacetone kinase subunit DhaK [Sinorhizobium meliloti]RVM08300.1 dihydroxyacetone kinase subunit DhaK [Sinorhizobium meliloti]
MKKLINNPSTVVREMLEGTVALGSHAALLADENVVVQSDLAEANGRKVAILSGGGSGHEPAHAGYVGRGMLTAAVAGDVFTSPSTDAVLSAIRAASGSAGALLIVKNYTGDRLNFGLAAEIARAEGIPVEIVVVADDVALRNSVPKERRRGIAGTVLVHKVAGAAAEKGLALAEVARLARHAADNIASMGISLGACTLPAVGKPGFELGEEEIEVGLGIHGEQGIRRMPIVSADDLCSLVLETMDADRPFIRGDRVALLVNGLGSTPPMELSIVARAALSALEARGVGVERAWAGTFLSALDMPGFSLSVTHLDDTLLDLLDAPTNAAAWPGKGRVNLGRVVSQPLKPVTAGGAHAASQTTEGLQVRELAARAAKAAIAAEDELTKLDSIAGDGDLGSSMKRGGEAILALSAADFADPSTGLASIGNALRRSIAGSSGPFYATGLLRASRRIADLPSPSAKDWSDAFSLAVEAISELGGAQPGDRTMVDALRPAADALKAGLDSGKPLEEAWRTAVEAAIVGADATKTMRPRLGRASYLGERAVGYPDGGAVAAATWLKALMP